VNNLVLEYTDKATLEEKIFTKEFLTEFCEKNISIALGTANKAQYLEEKRILEELFDDSGECKWIVRVVVCEMNTKSGGLMRILGNMMSSYGLVHIAIQIGPYLLDWLNSSELRIRPTESPSAVLFLYPCKDSHIIPSNKETRQKIVDYIFDYRKKKI